MLALSSLSKGKRVHPGQYTLAISMGVLRPDNGKLSDLNIRNGHI